jgi:hypothetical protein
VVVERSKIKSFQRSRTSLMPQELEKGLDHQAMADLLAYLKGQL